MLIESQEEGESRRALQQERLAMETEEQRATRLEGMQRRLDADSQEKRESRLECMCALQHERLSILKELPDSTVCSRTGQILNKHNYPCLNSNMFSRRC